MVECLNDEINLKYIYFSRLKYALRGEGVKGGEGWVLSSRQNY